MSHRVRSAVPDGIGLYEWIDLLDELAYVCTPDGTIVAYARAPWDRFALANGAPHLATPDAVLGQSVFSAIADEENRRVYRGYYHLLVSQLRAHIAFTYRCDGHTYGRQMAMQLQRVTLPDGGTGILHRTELRAKLPQEPPVFMQESDPTARAERDASVVKVCSYCQHVLCDAVAPANWILPREYYARGGSRRVRLTHGICPACYEHVVEPQLSV